jgi:hypothetical protein
MPPKKSPSNVLVPEAVDPVRELPKPLSQLSLEERQAWAFRLKAIRAAYDRFREPPAAKTVLRPWVKIALALLAYVAIAAVLSFIGCILPVVPLLHLL